MDTAIFDTSTSASFYSLGGCSSDFCCCNIYLVNSTVSLLNDPWVLLCFPGRSICSEGPDPGAAACASSRLVLSSKYPRSFMHLCLQCFCKGCIILCFSKSVLECTCSSFLKRKEMKIVFGNFEIVVCL